MCGIAGSFSLSDARPDVARMAESLSHRGPDDAGLAVLPGHDGPIGGAFAHRRLAILDLSPGGHQPMFSGDGRYCITYNGEIYNYAELRSELQTSGVTFRSASDTEVILAGWASSGAAFLEKMRGMFVFALWDSVTRRGYLARDNFGIKPLYFFESNGDVMFASEVRALLATGRVPRVMSRDAVAGYLATGSVVEPLTIVEGVRAVPAGSILEVRQGKGGFSVGGPVAFATPASRADPSHVSHVSHDEHVCRIRHALRESVRYHLVSDVPVGVFLSGGIDSAIVAGLASEVSAMPPETFTVTFDESSFSEAEPARDSARRFGTKHHEVHLSGTDLLSTLPDVFAAMDQPSLDGLNTFVVSRAVRSFGFKVALSGLGGDELFGGYPSFRRAQYLAPFWKLPKHLRKLGALGARGFSSGRFSRVPVLLEGDTPAIGAYRASRMLFGSGQISKLIARTVRDARTFEEPGSQSDDEISMTTMQQIARLEMTGYMRNTLLRDSDVFSMAHGLELRVPFVDEEVVRVAHEAAAALHLRRGEIKPMLVESVGDLLPPDITRRPKKGFTLPFETWMRNELSDEIKNEFRQIRSGDSVLASSAVMDVWTSFQTRRSGINWSRPWALYTLLRWSREHGLSCDESVPETVPRTPPTLAG